MDQLKTLTINGIQREIVDATARNAIDTLTPADIGAATEESVSQLRSDLIADLAYTLPAASATQLGGVMVGNGLEIDANGVLSLSVSNASGVSF